MARVHFEKPTQGNQTIMQKIHAPTELSAHKQTRMQTDRINEEPVLMTFLLLLLSLLLHGKLGNPVLKKGIKDED